MSLFKQVLLVIVVVFSLLFVTVGSVTFKILESSAKKSLLENMQNSATNISLSITNAGVDKSSIKSVISASFDNGNYEKIAFRDIEDALVFEVKKDTTINKEIPSWFINLYSLDEVSASSNVSSGWSNLGVLEIYANKATYYEQIYAIFNKLLTYMSIGFLLLLVSLYVLFRFILAPLKKVNNQAKAAMNNEFVVVDELPFTDEFKSVTLSINSMVRKFEKIFENTSELLKANKELAYIDEISKLYNRKYAVLKISEYLGSENLNSSGMFVVFSLKIDVINKTYGYVSTNQTLLKFANILKESFEFDSNLITRLNGPEFLVLCPNMQQDKLKSIVQKVVAQIEQIDELKENISIGVSRYENEKSIKDFFIKVDFTSGQARLSGSQDCYLINVDKAHRSKEEWIEILNDALVDNGIFFSFKDVINPKTKDVLYAQIFIELDKKEYSFAEFMASIRRLGRLNEVYFYIIKKALELKHTHRLSLKLPHEFVDDLNNYVPLKELLKKHQKSGLIFEIEEHTLSHNRQNSNMYIELFQGYGFSYAIYNFLANDDDYAYIKQNRPLYIKSSFEFLKSSNQSLNIVKMLTTSLGIKLIAVVLVEDMKISEIESLGVDAYVISR